MPNNRFFAQIPRLAPKEKNLETRRKGLKQKSVKSEQFCGIRAKWRKKFSWLQNAPQWLKTFTICTFSIFWKKNYLEIVGFYFKSAWLRQKFTKNNSLLQSIRFRDKHILCPHHHAQPLGKQILKLTSWVREKLQKLLYWESRFEIF